MSDQLLLKKLTAKNRNLATQIECLLSRERELLLDKKQLDEVFDNAPVELYLKDKEGRYLKINKYFEKIFGVKNDDLVGKLPETAHDPELAASTRDHDLAVLSSGKIQRREERALLATDNRIHTLLTIKFPLYDDADEVSGLGAIVTDITDQKQAEERFVNRVNTIDGSVCEYDAFNEE
jgi:PAS domain S-box-containing protein